MKEQLWLDELYDDYDNWKGWAAGKISAQERRLIDIEISRTGISSPARVLEIGFGTGAFLLHLQSLGYQCWGIERRTNYDAVLEQQGITVCTGDIADLPDQSFDLVCALDVFEHLEKQEIIVMLRKIRHLLKPGGRLLARFPNGASPFGAMNQSADLTHLTSLSISSFSQACNLSGLYVVGGWNSAVSWRADGALRSVLKPLTLLGRRLVEIVVGALFYGERRALDMNVTVCAERRR